MNFVGLILIAALSGGIVAVSLRLRASSSPWMSVDGDRLSEEDLQRPTHPTGYRTGWLKDPFGLKSESGMYRAVRDELGS
ncbi:MAG TPA: hypothetical protein VNO24_13800 [Blastocatellia bacterium]|nr:hypothetical protein [Blastocatellia bacterium]